MPDCRRIGAPIFPAVIYAFPHKCVFVAHFCIVASSLSLSIFGRLLSLSHKIRTSHHSFHRVLARLVAALLNILPSQPRVGAKESLLASFLPSLETTTTFA